MSLLERPSAGPPVQLDDATADRLLAGRIAPEDAPPGFGGVARLVIAARRPPSTEEIAGTDAAVRSALWVLRQAELVRPVRIPLVRRARGFVRTKVTALVFAGTLVGGTGMAAAGVLPAPVQNAAARALSAIGINVPTSGATLSPSSAMTEWTGSGHGAETSTEASRGHGHVGQNGQADQDHGQSEGPNGQSDGPHGQSDGSHGQSDGSHGQSTQPHGQSDQVHGQPDPAATGADASVPSPGHDDAAGMAGATGSTAPGDDGGGAPGSNGNGNGSNDGIGQGTPGGPSHLSGFPVR